MDNIEKINLKGISAPGPPSVKKPTELSAKEEEKETTYFNPSDSILIKNDIEPTIANKSKFLKNSALEQQAVNQKEMEEIKKVTSQDNGEFKIVSPQEKDSLGSEAWKTYLDSDKLKEAWSPPSGSPYSKYMKTKTINSVNFVGSKIKPRYSDGEIKSQKELENLIPNLGPDTLVIIDSGGPHSVAMAVTLCKKAGYQPVVMFNSIPHSKGSNKSEQELATLLYFANEMDNLKKEGKINPDAPPVFILDTHRNGRPYSESEIDNSYTYTENDFPSAEELKKRGIKRVIYINEGDQQGKINPDYQSIDRVAPDLKPIIKKWESSGIKIEYTGIQPWRNNITPSDSTIHN